LTSGGIFISDLSRQRCNLCLSARESWLSSHPNGITVQILHEALLLWRIVKFRWAWAILLTASV